MSRRDQFEHIIASKLVGEEVTPPADMFDRIKSARNQRKKGLLYWLRKYAAVLILVLTAGSLGLFWMSGLKEKDEQAVPSKVQEHLETDKSSDALLNQNKITESKAQSQEEENIVQNPSIPVNILDEINPTQNNSSQSEISEEHTPVSSPVEPMVAQNSPESKKAEKAENQAVPPAVAETQQEKEPLAVNESEERMEETTVEEDLIESAPEETEQQNREVLPNKALKSRWALGIDFGLGSHHSFYSGNANLVALNEESEKSRNSRSLAFALTYDINPNWSLESGLLLMENSRDVNHQWATTQTTYVVNERQVRVYDPLLPPRQMTIRDTTGSVTSTAKHQLEETHQQRRIYLPIGVSRHYRAGKWGVSSTLGIMLQLMESRSGWMIAAPGKSVDASAVAGDQTWGAAWMDLDVSHHIGHRTLISTGPRALFDIQENRHSGELNGLRHRDLVLQWQVGLKIAL